MNNQAAYQRLDSPTRGRHLVATRRILKGEVIFVEKPLLSLQSVGNSHTGALVCRCCRAFVGGPDLCLKVASGKIKRENVWNEVKSGSIKVDGDVMVPCRNNCGELYCSLKCERNLWESCGHDLLCTGLIPDPPDSEKLSEESVDTVGNDEHYSQNHDSLAVDEVGVLHTSLHPLLQFKVHAVRNNEILLMVGDLIATVVSLRRQQLEIEELHNKSDRISISDGITLTPLTLSDIMSAYLDFTSNPWWDIVTAPLLKNPSGFVEAIPLEKTLKQICYDSSQLLKDAFLELTKEQDSSTMNVKSSDRDTFRLTLAKAIEECNDLFTESFFGKIIGSFEQNAIGIRARHPLCRDVLEAPDLRRRCHLDLVRCIELAGMINGDDDDDSCNTSSVSTVGVNASNEVRVDSNGDEENCDYSIEEIADFLADLHIDEDGHTTNVSVTTSRKSIGSPSDSCGESAGDDLDALFAPLDGTAMFYTACKMNHSCDPNVVARYSNSRIHGGIVGKTRWGESFPLVLECVALNDINKGDELCISYISSDGDLKQRREELLSGYGFNCFCSKCTFEANISSPGSHPTATLTNDSNLLFGEDEDDMTAEEIRDEIGFSGNEKINQLLDRLDNCSSISRQGGIPAHILSHSIMFVFQIGSQLNTGFRERTIIREDRLHPWGVHLAASVENCLSAINQRAFAKCIQVGCEGEQLALSLLFDKGSWPNESFREAYGCYNVTGAIGYAYYGNFSASLAMLDRACLLGLPRKSVELLFDFVASHAKNLQKSYPIILRLRIITCVHNMNTDETGDQLTSNYVENHAVSINEIDWSADSSYTRILDAMQKRKPILVRNYARSWPAMKKWSNLGFFAEEHGHRIIPIELGYMFDRKGMKERMITFSEFFYQYLYPCRGSTVTDLNSLKDHHHLESYSVAYMAQHKLFDQIPELLDDVDSNPRLCSAVSDELQRNVWIGTSGTRTPLHFDSLDNLFVQISGCKYVRLYGTEEAEKLYVIKSDRSYGKQGNMSAVDCEREDYNRHPLAATAFFQEAVLRPGDALFIPSLVWHYVRGITSSASVNYWF